MLRALLLAAIFAWVPAVDTVTAAAGPPADWGDEQIERFLYKARIVSMEEIGSGVTRPLRVVLTRDGVTLRAAFKTIDHVKARVRLADGSVKKNFTDSYRYEPAAYLLSRRIGISLVPVSVVRSIGGKSGALTVWIEDAVTEKQWRERVEEVDDDLEFRYDLMEMFDALIYNVDRNLGNRLITPADRRLHLIDHSRSFRDTEELLQRFAVQRLRTTTEMLAQLESLEFGELKTLLRRYLSPAKIRALLVRRDRILAKFAADREAIGRDAVFCDCVHLH